MILRQLDLTTALRPALLPDEVLLFVQDAVGLYRDKYKVEVYQNGHAYLTSHRVCYVDNEEPRSRSVAIDLRDIDHPEFYAGFLKSSPKITLYPKQTKRSSYAARNTTLAAQYDRAAGSATSSPTRATFTSSNASPAPSIIATWICPICSFSNPVPANFDPGTANATTPIPPCQACGIKPALSHVSKAAIAAMTNRMSTAPANASAASKVTSGQPDAARSSTSYTNDMGSASFTECVRCTFRNHPSIRSCEICGAPLPQRKTPIQGIALPSHLRSESPAPMIPATEQENPMEIIKLSFRGGGEKTFYDRLKEALIQRKWLLETAPPPPKPQQLVTSSAAGVAPASSPNPATPRKIGIAGLESRGRELQQTNAAVMGSAFEDLEALMTSAKEVIAMAERFSVQNQAAQEGGKNGDGSRVLAQSATAMGLSSLVTKDMLGSASEKTYLTQLARDLAEFLTDDRTGVLKREGGIMTLVDLWAVFNRRRNGIELVSPRDFEAAARLWGELKMPIRLRSFRSGVMVVQGSEAEDGKICSSLQVWLKTFTEIPPDAWPTQNYGGQKEDQEVAWDWRLFGRGISVKEAAERFGWSIGVASEELEMAEERGVLVRSQDVSGASFWLNWFVTAEEPEPQRRGMGI